MNRGLVKPTSPRPAVATETNKERGTKGKRPFYSAAKSRIARAETKKHGHIPFGSFGSSAQSIVDRKAKPLKAA